MREPDRRVLEELKRVDPGLRAVWDPRMGQWCVRHRDRDTGHDYPITHTAELDERTVERVAAGNLRSGRLDPRELARQVEEGEADRAERQERAVSDHTEALGRDVARFLRYRNGG